MNLEAAALRACAVVAAVVSCSHASDTAAPALNDLAPSVFDLETTTCARPDGSLVAAWIGFEQPERRTFHIGYASKPVGGDWAAPLGVPAPKGLSASDPELSCAPDGSVFLSYLAFSVDPAVDRPYVRVARMRPGAPAFELAVDATHAGVGVDQPSIVATAGTLLVGYNCDPGFCVARSPDGGSSWSEQSLGEAVLHVSARLCRGPRRAWLSMNVGNGIFVRWSDDDGATWPSASRLQIHEDAEEPALAKESVPAIVCTDDEAWIVYGLTSDPEPVGSHALTAQGLTDLRLAHVLGSAGGVDWRSSALDKAAGRYALNPALVAEPDGALDLVYDAGGADGDASGALRRVRSSDRGKTFAPSVALKQPITLSLRRDSPQWTGDYMEAAWALGGLHVAYVDNADGRSRIAFADVTP